MEDLTLDITSRIGQEGQNVDKIVEFCVIKECHIVQKDNFIEQLPYLQCSSIAL